MGHTSPTVKSGTLIASLVAEGVSSKQPALQKVISSTSLGRSDLVSCWLSEVLLELLLVDLAGGFVETRFSNSFTWFTTPLFDFAFIGLDTETSKPLGGHKMCMKQVKYFGRSIFVFVEAHLLLLWTRAVERKFSLSFALNCPLFFTNQFLLSILELKELGNDNFSQSSTSVGMWSSFVKSSSYNNQSDRLLKKIIKLTRIISMLVICNWHLNHIFNNSVLSKDFEQWVLKNWVQVV